MRIPRRRRRNNITWASLLAAGMLFQSAQCNIAPDQLGSQLVTSMASVFLAGWVNDLFGVAPLVF